MTTDTSEKGLELLIVRSLTGFSDEQILKKPVAGVAEAPAAYGGAGYELGRSEDYDRDHAVDCAKLLTFLQSTQPTAFYQLGLATDGPGRLQFLNRLQGEIAKRGIVDVLRSGIAHNAVARIDLFYGIPSAGNIKAREQWDTNTFSVTRQLRYSKDETKLALDLVLFINGLPITTFELKNRLTKQTVDDAVQQYKRDRDPRELLFQFARCMVHFAVDDQGVMFCTRLAGKDSWFLPFDRGWHDGAGNPPNANGLKTDYLWKCILARASLTDILENYAQRVETKVEKSGRKTQSLIFPRYHQLDVVRKLLADAGANGAGKRYLIQHSAGSGKSNSIAWLAHQLVGLRKDAAPVFDSVIVVTDRVLLDRQIRDTIKQFAQVGSIVGHAEHSGQLKGFLKDGKKIVITTVQKFPVVLDDIGNEHRDRSFAILIDEAHSSQGGRTAAKMNIVLSQAGAEEEDEDTEDQINRIMAARKMLDNASYFAFTATPKNKTLEVFGDSVPEGDVKKHRPFHSYTMKQAIQEGFILDVLANYTPYHSFYNLVKTTEDDPEYDVKRAQRKLKLYVEGHEHAIGRKAEIMVDHFHDQVIAKQKIGGQARAMVVTGSIMRAIEYFQAFQAYLVERKSPYRAPSLPFPVSMN
jgi:type I restriction enzyme R subunit